jgi:hypothetical protein
VVGRDTYWVWFTGSRRSVSGPNSVAASSRVHFSSKTDPAYKSACWYGYIFETLDDAHDPNPKYSNCKTNASRPCWRNVTIPHFVPLQNKKNKIFFTFPRQEGV